jgi:hypothetical protein
LNGTFPLVTEVFCLLLEPIVGSVISVLSFGLFQMLSLFVEVGVPPGGSLGSGFHPWDRGIGSVVDDCGDIGNHAESRVSTSDVAEV